MFNIGDGVQFTNRKGKAEFGIVIDCKRAGNRMHHYFRYSVRTQSGLNYTIPERLLSEHKFDKRQSEVLLNAGNEFAEKKREHKENMNAQTAERMQPRMERLHPGMQVKVYSNNWWHDTVVVRLNKETGKVTVFNPKRILRDWAKDVLGADSSMAEIARRMNPKDVITVWANRIRLEDGGAL